MNPNKTTLLDSRLAAYAAVAGAALAAPALPSADATVVTNNINIAIPANIDGVYLNFLTGATGTSGGTTAGWDINVYLTNGVFTFFWNNTAPSVSGGVDTSAGGNVYASLSPGAVVSAASPFTASSGGGGAGSTVNYQSTGQHILGFRFYNEATAAINYGFAVFNNTSPNGFPATLVRYSYENNGGPITVPEPSTITLLGLVAAGGLGLREWRRRKAA